MSTPPDVSLRAYEPRDAQACAGIFARAWAAGHPYAPRQIDTGVFLDAIVERAVIVAQDAHGRLLGFVGIHEPDAFIHHLYVDPAASRRGVGRALLAEAVRRVGGRASLKCQLRNVRALAFYEALGWTRGETGGAGGELWVRMLSP